MNMNMKQPLYLSTVIEKRRSPLRCVAVVASLLLLVACASAPQPPMAALQAAELAIADADQARVADYASLELSEAREKLNAARAAVRQEKMTLALHLAEQSQVGAELASAKAEVAKAQAVNDDMQNSIDILKQEMQRHRGTIDRGTIDRGTTDRGDRQ